jgi:DNA-binding GntR family transcriptional regulator
MQVAMQNNAYVPACNISSEGIPVIVITTPTGQIGRRVLDTPAVDLAELRLLIELPALRRLADRGLSDQELVLVTKLADATMRPARGGDVPGYLRADMVFHLCLLELSGDPAVAEIARPLLAPRPGRAPRGAELGRLMATKAREHRELVGLLADGMVSAADDLLRLHLSRLAAGRPPPARHGRPEPSGYAGG